MSKPDPKRPVKALVAGAVFVGGWIGTSLADGVITAQEWGFGVAGLAAAVGLVYGVSNPQVPE